MKKDSILWSEIEPRQQGCTIAYARASTNLQTTDRQINNILQEYPYAKVMAEIYTGTTLDRPVWKQVMRMVERREVKCIVFDEVSRISRNAEQGIELYKELYSKGVELVFLKEPHVNTSALRESIRSQIQVDVESGDDAANNLMRAIIVALNDYAIAMTTHQIELCFMAAEREVVLLRQRTKEGMLQAKLNGKQIGRKEGSTYETKKSKESKKMALQG